ncbi:hypothetical protein Q3G72_028618 [Acer saccharum]|nr:hypothetical protein Q3G72_028618 [Acer saccharum]
MLTARSTLHRLAARSTRSDLPFIPCRCTSSSYDSHCDQAIGVVRFSSPMSSDFQSFLAADSTGEGASFLRRRRHQ